MIRRAVPQSVALWPSRMLSWMHFPALSFSGQPAASSHSPLPHPPYMSRTLHVPRNNGTGELVATTLADVAVELASDWSAHWLRTARQAASVDRRSSWHSEEGQDKIVAELLGHKRGGFHIDLAANGAVFGSNTRALERDYGWSGVCIEANPRYWAALVTGVRSCHLVGAAIVGRSAEGLSVRFLPQKAQGRVVLPGEEGPSLDAASAAKGGGLSSLITARATSLRRVLQAAPLNVPQTIDYFSLDIEGAELLALSTFPWKKHRFAVMTVERPRQPLRDLLESKGYSYVCHLGYQPDEVWVHLELASQRWSPKVRIGSKLGLTHLMQCVARLFPAAGNGTATVSRQGCSCLNNAVTSKRLE